MGGLSFEYFRKRLLLVLRCPDFTQNKFLESGTILKDMHFSSHQIRNLFDEFSILNN